MVRYNTLKTKILSGIFISCTAVFAVFGCGAVYATCDLNEDLVMECDEDANFQVNIPEILTITVTRPNEWATGDVDTFLRNVVNLKVVTNSSAGFAATMTSGSTTIEGAALANTYAGSTTTIPMLTGSWTRSNTTIKKFWGYSMDDSTYNAVALKNAATPSPLFSSTTAGTIAKDIYFGAKADETVDSGVYKGTIIISVVTGVTD